MDADDLDSTGLRRALTDAAHAAGHEGAEALYRAIAGLRDQLSPEVQKQLAAAFEWAREGVNAQISRSETSELVALYAAYTYARDVLTARAERAAAPLTAV